jgi:alpha/beta superfamily hydrolase
MTKTETVWIDCEKARLYAEIYIPNHVPAPAVLICHGMDVQGFHYLKIYRQLAKRLCEDGFVSLVFDFRGVGKSGGHFDYGFGEQQDVRCAIDYLVSRSEVIPNRVFVVGHSLGGAVSLYALQNETRVKGLVLWSVPKNHNYNVKKFITRTRGKLGLYLFLFFSQIDRFVNVQRLVNLQVYGIRLRPKYVRQKLMKLEETEAISKLRDLPVLIVVGDSDVIVGKDEAEEVYLHAHDPKTLLFIESAGHNYKGKEDELVRRTIEWLKKR